MISLLTLATAVSAGVMRGSELRDSKSCKPYICNSVLKFDNSTCGEWFDNAYNMEPCKDPNMPVCTAPSEFEYEGNWKCNAFTIANGSAYPGEACTTDAQCKSNNCGLNQCVGISRGEGPCTATSDCNPGLHCAVDTTCQPLLNLGFACVQTSDCVLGAYCEKNLCVEMLSLENGAKLDECDQSTDVNLKCRSGSCLNVGGLFSTDYECAEAPVSINNNPYPCATDGVCSGLQGTSTVVGKCECGYNPQGQSYCNGHAGDPDAQKFIANLKQFYSTTAAKSLLHSDRRDTIQGIIAAGDYELAKELLYVQYLPQLQGVDSACLSGTVSQFYYHIAFGGITGFIAALLLLN